MKPLAHLEVMPRVGSDIDDCLEFIRRQPWGKPDDRKLDIAYGIDAAHRTPLRNPVKVHRPATGLALRRHNVA